MAPEQLAGAEVTPRSDIYALGLVLYELFTGQRAIEAKNVAELVRKREAGILPPSQIVRELELRAADPEVVRERFAGLDPLGTVAQGLLRRGQVPRVVYADAVRLA